MKLSRYRQPETPARGEGSDLDWIRNQIEHLFDSPFGLATPSTFMEGWAPTVDIYEDKDKVTVQAQLPGMKKEDIDLSLHGNTLNITGERKHEEEHEQGETFRSERFFGRFQRSIPLPGSVDASKVQARYKDGVLTVTLPKTEEARRKQIEVKTD